MALTSLGGISVSFGSNISAFKAGISEMTADMNAFSKQASSVANSASASMGSAFSKVSSAASSATSTMGGVFSRLQSAMAAAQTGMPAFHSAWQNITNALGSAGSAVSSVWSKFTGFTGGLINHVTQLGQTVFFTKALAEAGIGLVGSLFNQNAAMEQTRIGFVGLLGSGQKADAMLKQLQDFAAATPFEFPELAKDAQMLVGMGFAAKDVIPMMTSVGDAVAGVGAGAGGVETVTRVLGQMQAAGKVNAGDMMQITTLGIPAWKILADSMHITVSEAMNLSSKGLIPAKVGVDALVGGMEKMYGGQMANQAQTFNGIISTLHDNLSMAFQTFLTPAFNLAKSGLNILANIVSSPKFAEFAKIMGDQLATALKRVVDFIAPLIPRIQQLVAQFFASGGMAQRLGTFLQTYVVVPVTHLVTVIGPLVARFAEWAVNSGALGTAIQILGAVIGGVVVVIGTLVDWTASLIDWFAKGSVPAQILAATLIGIGVAIAAINIAAFVATIPALVAGFITWAVTAGAAAIATLAATWPLLALGAAIALVVAGIILAIRNWGAITAWLQGVWTGFLTIMAGIWEQIKVIFFGALNAIGSFTSSFFPMLGNIILGGLNAIVSYFKNLLNAALQTVIGVWNMINAATGGQLGGWLNFIGGILAAIANIFLAVLGKAVGFVVNAWVAVNNATSTMWGNIFSFLGGVLSNIGSAISSHMSQAVTFIGNAWNSANQGTATMWSNIWNTVSSKASSIASTVADKTQGARNFLYNAWVSANQATSQMWGNIFNTVGNFLNQMWQRVVSIGNNIKNSFLGVWNSIAGAIGGVIRGMANNAISVLNGMLSSLQGFVNGLASGINAIARAVGASASVSAPSIGRISYLAKGTKNFMGGPAIVGEEGPELIVLPKGTSVMPSPQTKALLQTGLVGGVPGFAAGTGNAFSDLLGWIGGGVTAVGNLASSAINVTKEVASQVLSHVFSSTLTMAGPLSGMASAIGSMIRSWGVDMVMGLLKQIKAVVAPPITGGSGGASFAGTGSVADWISQALSISGYPASWLGPLTLIAMHESGGNPNSINLWDCVILDTMILTKRGWLDYTQVLPGDETIGFNPATGKSEWTRIQNVFYYEDAEVYEIGHARWKATTTLNHRWYGYEKTLEPQTTLQTCPYCTYTGSTQGIRVHLGKIHSVRELPKDREPYKRYGMFTTDAIKHQHTIITAVQATTPDNPAISVQEAAILGWVLGDGHVEKKSAAPRGRKLPSLLIYQAKPQHIETIRTLLQGIPHAEYSYDPKPGLHKGYQWRLDPTYAQDLLMRSGYDENNPTAFVLSLSTEQRSAWLQAVIDAEGTRDNDPHAGERGGTGTMIYQRVGPKLDAIQLAVYLEGYRPGMHYVKRTDARAANWQPEASINMCKPVVSGAFLQRQRVENQPVWCVTTELGTWTAKQDNHIFLTGNSNARAGIPSKGLMQTIDPTFNAYALPGHGNIWNPIDNAIAAIRYIQSRYGGVYNVPGVVNMMHGGPYVGYGSGGIISEQIAGIGLSSGRNYRFGENGPETVTPGRNVTGSTTIILQVDGRALAQALGSHMVKEIKLVTGRNQVQL